MSRLSHDKARPAFIIAGLFIGQDALQPLTQDFLALKSRFNPAALPAGSRRLDWIAHEVKGNDLRRQVSEGSHRKRRSAIGFLDNARGLLERHEVRIVARVWVKEVGVPVNQVSIYSHSVQYICEHFEDYLSARDAPGHAILDSRSPHQNINVSHSIFTQKHKSAGDAYPHLSDAPAFGTAITTPGCSSRTRSARRSSGRWRCTPTARARSPTCTCAAVTGSSRPVKARG